MTTLRRELRLKFEEVIRQQAVFCSDGLELESPYKETISELAEFLADAALSIRGIALLEKEEEPRTDVQKRGNLVDGILAMRDAPGIKREAKVDAILSYIGGKLQINTETKRWKSFAKFAYDKHLEGQQIETFISWVMGQKNFDVQFWPPQKMEEMWPQAFAKKTDEERPEYKPYVDPREGLTFTLPPKRTE